MSTEEIYKALRENLEAAETEARELRELLNNDRSKDTVQLEIAVLTADESVLVAQRTLATVVELLIAEQPKRTDNPESLYNYLRASFFSLFQNGRYRKIKKE